MPREIAEGITVDPAVMVGKPVIKGTRVPVELILAKLSADPNVDELLIDYPHLTVAQIQDCLRYAANLVPQRLFDEGGSAIADLHAPRAV